MNKFVGSLSSLLISVVLSAQSNSFGLLKFNIPANWQQQTKQQVVSYSGNEGETNIPMEIKVYENEPAGIKADSSFKIAWQKVMSSYGSPAIPFAKKRYASSGLQIAINQAAPIEITENNQKKFTQLLVFIIDKQMQAFQFIASNAADFKLLRPYIDEFIENVDTIAKRD